MEAIAQHLLGLERRIPIGVDGLDLKDTCITIREFKTVLPGLWVTMKLPGQPLISGSKVVETDYTPDMIGFTFGGALEEAMPMPFGMVITGENEAGERVAINGPSGTEEHILNDNRNRTMGDRPFSRQLPMSVKDYFDAPVAVIRQTAVSRWHFAEYAFYEKGYLHAPDDIWRKRHPGPASLIDDLNGENLGTVRDNVDYMLLSIARDILASSASETFLEEATKRGLLRGYK